MIEPIAGLGGPNCGPSLHRSDHNGNPSARRLPVAAEHQASLQQTRVHAP